MPEDEVPEFAKQAVEMQEFQQRQYQKAAKEREENYNADLSAFVTFINELSSDQVEYLKGLIEDVGANAYSQRLIGVIVGQQVFQRGLMVDGKTYEEALGLNTDASELVLPEEMQAQNLPTPQEPTVVEPTEPIIARSLIEDGERKVQAIMDRWGLIYTDTGLVCEACGKPYATAEDAEETFIKFDGCPGCHQKQKWG